MDDLKVRTIIFRFDIGETMRCISTRSLRTLQVIRSSRHTRYFSYYHYYC
jgi:hypothetical protein